MDRKEINMADIKKYDFYNQNPDEGGPMTNRNVIGTMRKYESEAKGKNVKPGQKVTGYLCNFQLDAHDPKTIKSAEANPSGAGNLNLHTYNYKGNDGSEKIGHNVFYSESQANKILEAAGNNVAPQQDKDGKKIKDAHVVALQANLVVSSGGKHGIVLNTEAPMGPSEVANFGKSGAKARKAMTAQYDAMRSWRAEAEAAKSAQAEARQVDAPEAQAEAAAEMEAGQ